MKFTLLNYWLGMFSLATAGLCYGFFGRLFGRGKKKDDKNKDFFQNQSLAAIADVGRRSPEEEQMAGQSAEWRGLRDFSGKLPNSFVGLDTREDAARRRALEAQAVPTGIAALGAPNATMMALANQDRANENANMDAHGYEQYIDENKRAAYGVANDQIDRDYNRKNTMAGLYQGAYGQKLGRDQFAKQTGFWRTLGSSFANSLGGAAGGAASGALFGAGG
jgi:hypothetical protein